MALPTVNDVQAVDPVLTNLLLGYMQADTRFVASKVFKPIPGDKDSGTYYIFTKKYWFLDEMKRRAPGSQFARAGYGVETNTYTTVQWGLEHPIPDEARANSQVPMDLEEAGLRWLATQSNIRKERAWAADFMKASVWDNQDNDAATDWDDFSAGDPVNDILSGKKTVSDATGVDANALVLGLIVHNALINHPDVLDRVKYTTQATQGNLEAALAALLGVEQYLVGRASYNIANEGATFSGAAIIDDDALLCHVPPNPGILVPASGYSFYWQPGGGLGAADSYYEKSTKSTILQHSEQWDHVVVAADLGYLWLGIV